MSAFGGPAVAWNPNEIDQIPGTPVSANPISAALPGTPLSLTEGEGAPSGSRPGSRRASSSGQVPLEDVIEPPSREGSRRSSRREADKENMTPASGSRKGSRRGSTREEKDVFATPAVIPPGMRLKPTPSIRLLWKTRDQEQSLVAGIQFWPSKELRTAWKWTERAAWEQEWLRWEYKEHLRMMDEWREWTHRQIIYKKVMGKFQNIALAMGFEGWQDWYGERIEFLEHLRICLARMQNSGMVRALNNYRDMAYLWKEQKDLKQFGRKYKDTREKGIHFRSWRAYIASCNKRKQ